jgi:hypothetical protein
MELEQCCQIYCFNGSRRLFDPKFYRFFSVYCFFTVYRFWVQNLPFILKISTVSTVFTVFKESSLNKTSLFSRLGFLTFLNFIVESSESEIEENKILKYLLSFPFGTAGVERDFSLLSIIHSQLRNRLQEDTVDC